MEDIEKLFTAIESCINPKTSHYSVTFRRQSAYPLSIAELPTDFSIEVHSPKEKKLKQLLLFVDASKVFEKGSVEDAVLSIPYRYGCPDENVFIHIVASSGFTLKTIEACNQYTWLRLFRVANMDADFRLHRNNHLPYSIDEDQDDFLAEHARHNHFYLQNRYKSLLEYLELQGIHIKKEYILKPDILKKNDIEERANEILSSIDSDKTGIERLNAIAEQLQLNVVHQKMQESLFGYYSLADNAIFLNSLFDNDNNFRDRFTFAHELGHCALHKEKFEQCKINRTEDDNFTTFNNIDTTNDNVVWLEWQANQFASFILMPKEEIIRIFYYCARALYEQNKCAENMRRVIQMGYLWLDPHDSLSDNREAAYSLITEISSKTHISKEAIKYRLIDLQLIKKPETTHRKELVACLTETLFTY